MTGALLHGATEDVPRNRPAKVRGASLPQEYELHNFVEKLKHCLPQWNTTYPACEWPLVKCNPHGKLDTLNWSWVELEGPPSWVHVPHTLRFIDLSLNKLTGTLPLDLMPPEIITLDLHQNQFTGELQLDKLPLSMKELKLDKNAFDGWVSFSKLPIGLQVLSLTGNRNLSGNVVIDELPPSLVTFRVRSRTKIKQVLILPGDN